MKRFSCIGQLYCRSSAQKQAKQIHEEEKKGHIFVWKYFSWLWHILLPIPSPLPFWKCSKVSSKSGALHNQWTSGVDPKYPLEIQLLSSIIPFAALSSLSDRNVPIRFHKEIFDHFYQISVNLSNIYHRNNLLVDICIYLWSV